MKISKGDVVFIAVFVALLFSLHPILVSLTGTSTPMAVVEGRSMLPLFRKGDVVLLVHRSADQIHVGDIIVYKSLRGHLIIHRVIAIIKIDGSIEYVTKGDNNPRDDSFLFEFPQGRGVSYDRVVGVVWSIHGVAFKIPYLGIVTLLFS